jgi:hypothetical protein
MKTLFHYTTKKGMDSILATNTIQPSDPLTTMDAAYGTGYYMTDLDLQKCNILVALICWQSVEALEKVECYLKFEVEEGAFIKCRENVYLINNWDTNKIKYIEAKTVPSCPKYPCKTCEQGKSIIANFKKN